MHDGQNLVVELEGENLKLLNQIQKDDHANLIKHLSKLEVHNLNLQFKYQHLVEKIKTSSSKISLDALEFDAFFEISKRDEKIQAHTNTIRMLRSEIAKLKSARCNSCDTFMPPPIDSQSVQKVNTINKLQSDVEWFQAENAKIKQHYKELFDSVKITRDKNDEKITSL